MRFVLFYHSLISDWNHGNAHFLRGVVRELQSQGHRVDVFEPANGWSLRNLLENEGPAAINAFHDSYPTLRSSLYQPDEIDLERALDGADVVLVHEWNEPDLVSRIGRLRSRGARFKLLFHDTHHRAVSDTADLRNRSCNGSQRGGMKWPIERCIRLNIATSCGGGAPGFSRHSHSVSSPESHSRFCFL